MSLLIGGGHGFEVLESLEMIDVKQSPYVGELGKTRLSSELPARLEYCSEFGAA